MVDYVLIDVAFAVPRLAGRLHDSRSPRCQPVASSPIRTYTQSQLTCDNDRNEAFHELLSSASGASIWRGYDYFKEGKVEAYEQLAENIFESRIQGSAEDPTIPSSTSSIPSVSLRLPFRKRQASCLQAHGRIVLHRVSQRSRRLPARSQGTEKGRRAPAARALQRDRTLVQKPEKRRASKSSSTTRSLSLKRGTTGIDSATYAQTRPRK